MASESEIPEPASSGDESTESSQEQSNDLVVDQAVDAKVLKDNEQGAIALEASYSFLGPVPPPAILAGYNNVVPDGADRIIRMAEKEQNHRHEIENKIVDKESFEKRAGLVFAFIIAVLALAASGYLLIFTDKSWQGLGVFVTEFAGLVWVFLRANRKRRREDDEE